MDDSRTIYCGNLAKDVTEELLFELFLQNHSDFYVGDRNFQAGPVDRVNIPKDKQGIQRNFGFILFKHDISVPYAVELMAGTKLYGQAIRLQARTSNSDSSPEITQHPSARHQKAMTCPPGFSFNFNHRLNNHGSGNNRHGSRLSNGEDYRSQQVQYQHNSPSTPRNGYNGHIFNNSPIAQPNFAHCPVELPLAFRPDSDFILQNQHTYQQNWPVRANRWMRN